MKVVIIGMTGRPLTYNVTKGIIESNFKLDKVILQKRFCNRGSTLKFIFKSISKHGIYFLFDRLSEMTINRKLTIDKLCALNNVNLLKVKNVNSKYVQLELEKTKLDVIVLAGPPIIKEHIFSKAKLYTINSHRSLLPKYAGLDAIFWALYNGENEIGATVHTVTKGIDDGKIITQRRKKIERLDNIKTLTDWYYNIASEMIIEALNLISEKDHKFQEQDMTERTYYSWPTRKQRKELKKRLKQRR